MCLIILKVLPMMSDNDCDSDSDGAENCDDDPVDSECDDDE